MGSAQYRPVRHGMGRRGSAALGGATLPIVRIALIVALLVLVGAALPGSPQGARPAGRAAKVHVSPAAVLPRRSRARLGASAPPVAFDSPSRRLAPRLAPHGVEPAELTLRRWCVRYLAYLGAPAKPARDARVAFLERWATLEGTYLLGNRHNPLDTEMPAPGARLWNAVGVRRYRTLAQGFWATRATMALGFNKPILLALRRRDVTMARLAVALAESDWTGRGRRSWVEQGYASRVSGQPLASFGLPVPTVSIRGTVVGPYAHPRGDVCVAAVHPGAPTHRATTAANGTFELSRLPRTRYRLELTDCRGGTSAGSPVFYDARSKRNGRTADPHLATRLSRACSEDASCRDERIALEHAIEFGRTTPPLAWRGPVAITYGTRLSRTQLDATAPVPGTFRYEPSLSTQLSGGVHELRAVFRPENAGAFAAATIERPISVHAATPQLRWSTPAPIRTTTPVSAQQLDATAVVPGTTTEVPGRMGYSIPQGVRLAPGRHVIRVTFVPADPTDYAVVRAAVSLSVS